MKKRTILAISACVVMCTSTACGSSVDLSNPGTSVNQIGGDSSSGDNSSNGGGNDYSNFQGVSDKDGILEYSMEFQYTEDDIISCESIKAAFDIVCKDSICRSEMIETGSFTVHITDAESVYDVCLPVGERFAMGMESLLGNLKNPESDGATRYILSWDIEGDEITNVTYNTDNKVIEE